MAGPCRRRPESLGAHAVLIEDAEGLDPAWLDGVRAVGVTAGASAPEALVQGVLDRLRELGCGEVENVSIVEEDVTFTLPPELRRDLPGPAL